MQHWFQQALKQRTGIEVRGIAGLRAHADRHAAVDFVEWLKPGADRWHEAMHTVESTLSIAEILRAR
jgi:hypothetical protein